jgi:hypothetical protein
MSISPTFHDSTPGAIFSPIWYSISISRRNTADKRETTMRNMRRFFCAWMDVDGVAVIRGGCAVYPVLAITKTTGLITNPHRVLGCRNRGN